MTKNQPDTIIDITNEAVLTEAPQALPRQWEFGQLIDLGVVNDGDSIHIDDSSRLNQFESALVAAKLPNIGSKHRYNWDTRSPLTEALRPKRFNLQLRNVVAFILEDAYGQLAERFGNARKKYESEGRANTIGFRVAANLYSTGRGVLGAVDSRVWIFRTKPCNSPLYSDLSRKVEPIAIQEPAVRAIEDARTIGEMLLKKAIEHPFATGFEFSHRRH